TKHRKYNYLKMMIGKRSLWNPEEFNGVRETVLIIAVRENNYRMVEELLKSGVLVDGDDRNLTTPLHEAITADNVDIARLLLTENASVSRRSPLYNGKSPFVRVKEGENNNMKALFGSQQVLRRVSVYDTGSHVDLLNCDKDLPEVDSVE